jgi:transposase
LDKEPAKKAAFDHTVQGKRKMIADLKRQAKEAGGARIVVAYEASGLGYSLYDELTAAGIECHVLSPSGIKRSVKGRKRKTDAEDARLIQEVVRGYVLAGIEMPTVWVPDVQTRQDRELVRMRLTAGVQARRFKNQVQSFLKRNGLRKPAGMAQAWSVPHRKWLASLTRAASLAEAVRLALASLLRQMEALEKEVEQLDEALERLAQDERYANASRALQEHKGVGLLAAMVYLTEIGDASRFANRRKIANYWGIVPSCFESGEADDRKGHITHHGSARVRHVLCQVVWSQIRTCPEEMARYMKIVERNPKHKMIAVVAMMRRTAIRLWHTALEVQQREGTFARKAA